MAFPSTFTILTSTPPFSTTRSQFSKLILSHRPICCTFVSSRQHDHRHHHQPVQSCTNTNTKLCNSSVARRSGNYQPCIWDDKYLQSLSNHYTGEMYTKRAQKLMGIVRMMLKNTDHEPFDQLLELIDSLQRLGLAYHFKAEIRNVLQHINKKMSSDDDYHQRKMGTLHATALKFRLLREHGYYVSSDIFERFKDKRGSFKPSICSDLKGMLSLYEASFYGMEGETILDEALDLSTKFLKDNADKNADNPNLGMQVRHALEFPLHWRMERLEARWAIEAYERTDTNLVLLELAKLDYNILQAMYQEELKDVSIWWKNTNLGERLSFARNRLVASFLWAMGTAVEPQFVHCRRMLAKITALIVVVDDIYDIYGTLDELELFTEVFERWDINEMQQLPDYMKICFLAVYNTVNEIAYDILKEQGVDVVQHLKKAWTRFVKAHLLEAKWYHTAYTPTLEEYLNNAWVSVAGPVGAVFAHLVVTKPISEKGLEFLESYPDILKWTSMIIRLEDDLGTSTDELKRGDVPKSIQCYMRETGASEEAAREHIRELVREAWKKVNKYRAEDSPLPQTSIKFMLNAARTAHCVYQHGDGHGAQDLTKDMASWLLFEPVPL